KGYYKAEDLKKCVKKQITPYVPKQTYSNGTGDRDFYSDQFFYDAEKTYTGAQGEKSFTFLEIESPKLRA
ncbi:MAG TPA: hypothetical protein VN379_21715, partial [Sporomusa sp.]|nr:hypothetical protein [Sporomusa sp.]